MSSTEFEIFDGKSLSSLFKDIYENSVDNRKQISILLENLSTFIKNTDTAVRLVPVIKEYLDITVKNDDQLIRLAGIVQKLITAESRETESGVALSDSEKQQLLKTFEDSINDIKNTSNTISSTIKNKKKTPALS